ncbi:MAG: D-aminoacylase, partial [Candidatus Thorarchaeota archaeon]
MVEQVDILIRNGIFHDGSGKDPSRQNISIRDGKINQIEKELQTDTRLEIDAQDLVVCPGFIDMHSHSDMTLPFDNRLESTIRQGITTQVIG